jgi:hypothetical protein
MRKKPLFSIHSVFLDSGGQIWPPIIKHKENMINAVAERNTSHQKLIKTFFITHQKLAIIKILPILQRFKEFYFCHCCSHDHTNESFSVSFLFSVYKFKSWIL